MAEKAMHPHSAVIALTYADDTQLGRDGAAMFAYADVRLFLARLRRAAAYIAKKEKWNVVPYVRFIVAGEQGSRNGRCHWHLILYTNFDISRLGKFRLRGKLVAHRRDMLSVGKRKRRLNWTLWEHGFMTLQEPDEGGMAYVLSYCLKDQFTEEASHGSMREAKVENFATGLFRMSKRPAIGEDWLMRKMESLLEKGSVLPSLQLKIPDASGYWQPSGSFRKKLLWCLVALNRRIVWATGANAPQWSSLLSSVAALTADLELLNGETFRQKADDLTGDDLERSARIAAGETRTREVRRTCGRAVACYLCLNSASEAELLREGIGREQEAGKQSRYYSLPGWPDFDARRSTFIAGENRLCQKRGSKENRRAFPRTGGYAP